MERLFIARVETDTGDFWQVENREDIVESFYNESLKFVDDKTAKKLGIKAGQRKDSLDDEQQETLESDLEYADTYSSDYIRLDEIDETAIYTDDYTDVFFTGAEILGWETETYLWKHNAQNWTMTQVEETKEIEVEFVENKTFQDGTCGIRYYKTEAGNIEVEYSLYAGSTDTIDPKFDDVIENLKG